MGSLRVSSCRCCMFVSCVHPVTVLNTAFCMTFSLLMLVEDTRGDQTTQPTRTRWMAGTAPHKSGRCRDKSRSDKHTQTSLDLRYLPQTNTG